jgi:hypothetical protein
VNRSCPDSAELLLAVLRSAEDATDAPVVGHVSDCEACSRKQSDLRGMVRALRAAAPRTPNGDACLDAHDHARLIDGADPAAEPHVLAHLAACGDCRWQLGETLRLVRDPIVAAELEKSDSSLRIPRRRGSRLALAGGLAAAAVLGALLLSPQAVRMLQPGMAPVETYRERTITTTAAPRILAPIGAAAADDSLVWTNVPGADLYRITFWRPDGTVAWQGESRDTVLAIPAVLSNSADGSLLWEVRARTGWDRWVVSDLVETSLGSPGGISR